jgi:hypothetical protein
MRRFVRHHTVTVTSKIFIGEAVLLDCTKELLMARFYWMYRTLFNDTLSAAETAFLLSLHQPRGLTKTVMHTFGVQAEIQTGPFRTRTGIALRVVFRSTGGVSNYFAFAPQAHSLQYFLQSCITDRGSGTTLATSFTMKMLDDVVQSLPLPRCYTLVWW